MKIVADIDIPYIRGVMEPYATVVYLKGGEIDPSHISDADALVIRTRTRCDSALLDGSGVKVIATATIGFDHIDTAYCAAARIKIATAAGSNARAVLQWMGAALVYASQQQGWKPQDKTIGIVGVGNVGSVVSDYARRWGFNVLCCDPPRERMGEKAPGDGAFVSFDSLAEHSDIITFHVPLTAAGEYATHHMAGRNFFDKMKSGTLLINSSRGEVVDGNLLSDAVEKGRCLCIIDTWEHEPSIDTALLERTLLGTPHIAGYSAQGKANAASMAVRAVAMELGLPLTDWYPYEDVPKIKPEPISWLELERTIALHYDICADDRRLRGHPTDFEEIRNKYDYRGEYF